ncbi:MAG: hypothetical protein OXG36_14685 [Caldilineaceae bacterium]|nr:hypothetical protein [Caldilineaceae bacterium]
MTNIAPLSAYDIHDTWRAKSYGWRGFPARLGKAVPADTPGNISAVREAHADSRNQIARRHMEPGSGPANIIPCPILARDLQ